MLSSRALAALICPSAPFLVPVRASRALGIACLQQSPPRSYATSARRPHKPSKFLERVKDERRKSAKRASYIGPVTKYQRDLLHEFRSQLRAGKMSQFVQTYQDVVEQKLLTPTDTLELARVLHTYYRNNKRSPALVSAVIAFAEDFTTDFQNGKVPAHRAASLHLLSLFKESQQYDKGVELWAWLQEQTDEYVDAAVYGAAIEMLAYQGSTSLKSLEELYDLALQRFPGGFAEYHLSPEAIIPDRSQPVAIKGLPMVLLQGIMTARLLHGDWRRAYLGLDTALRLFPNQVPSRFFELFMLERPLAEAYKVFMLACRGGCVLLPHRLTSLLDQLVSAMAFSSIPLKMEILDRMANAIFAFAGAGGTITGPHVGVLVKGFSMLLPERTPTHQAEEWSSLKNPIILLAQKVTQAFTGVGVPPTDALYGALISLAGRARSEKMLEETLNEMDAIGLKVNPIIRRVVLNASGHIGNKELISNVWQALVADARNQPRSLEIKDWLALVKACKESGNEAYVQQQVNEIDFVTQDIASFVERYLAKEERPAPVADESLDVPVLTAGIQRLLERVNSTLQYIKFAGVARHDFYDEPIPMSLRPSVFPVHSGNRDALSTLYDELTVDPSRPPPPEAAPDGKPVPVPTTATGFPFDELRFANWLSMNEILADAEAFEKAKSKVVEEAIAAGAKVDPKILEKLKALGPSPDGQAGATGEVQEELPLEELRKRVWELRGIAPAETVAALE